MRSFLFLICASAAFLLNLAQANAENVPLVNIDPSTQIDLGSGTLQPGQIARGEDEVHGNGLIGWGFNVLQPVTVTEVGWYDDGQDGLSRAFKVGLWAGLGSSQELLSGNGINIPTSTSAALNGVYRVVDLTTPLTLQPGLYLLGGLDTASTVDPIVYGQMDGNNLTTDPTLTGGRVSFGLYFWSTGGGQNGFVDPPAGTGFPLNYGIELGPMLFISVPEPASVVLLAVAGAGLLIWLARRVR